MAVPRFRLIFIAVLLLAGAAYVDGSHSRQETTRTIARLTAEEARAALLRVEGPGLGLTDLEIGPITWNSNSTVAIGKFCYCDLAARTWSVEYGGHCRFRYQGRFERDPNGTWRALCQRSEIA